MTEHQADDKSLDWRELSAFDNHEFLMALTDEASGLKAYVAIHNTNRGPALGGTRFKMYDSDLAAVEDVLNLSKAMTNKCALAGLSFGGGKAVIVNSPGLDRRKVLQAYARLIDKLDGLFKTGTDVGVSDADVRFMAESTTHMLGVIEADRGDLTTSSIAGLGVYYSAKAALKQLYGSDSFLNRSIAIKGTGKVGSALAQLVTDEGGKVIVSDIEHDQCKRLQVAIPSIQISDNFHIHRQVVDVYAPCALGQEFTESTVEELQCRAIAGGANNQLASLEIGYVLHDKGILYAPDYIVNAGGLLYVADELEPGGFNSARVHERTAAIQNILRQIFERAAIENLPPFVVADRIAAERTAFRAEGASRDI